MLLCNLIKIPEAIFIEELQFKDENWKKWFRKTQFFIQYTKDMHIAIDCYDTKEEAELRWAAIRKHIKSKTRYCCECGTIMDQTSKRYEVNDPYCGPSYDTSYYWTCSKCKRQEPRE